MPPIAELSSPYLTPDWARLWRDHRSDVRVAVWRDAAGEAVGFLPVQRCGAYAAMPAGGPICDYQALVAKPGAKRWISRWRRRRWRWGGSI